MNEPNPANTVELLRKRAESDAVKSRDCELMRRAADLIQLQQDRMAEMSHQITALQSKVHLCAGYDQLEAENERLRSRLDHFQRGFETILGAVPSNWCDPLLTGSDGINVPADCPNIEKLLNGLKDRIKAIVEEAIAVEGNVTVTPPDWDKCPSCGGNWEPGKIHACPADEGRGECGHSQLDPDCPACPPAPAEAEHCPEPGCFLVAGHSEPCSPGNPGTEERAATEQGTDCFWPKCGCKHYLDCDK